jgi:hypothetical protein
MAKCPSCEKTFSSVTGEHTKVSVPAGRTWHGIVYMCPLCHAALSVEIDPIALKADIVQEVVKALRE